MSTLLAILPSRSALRISLLPMLLLLFVPAQPTGLPGVEGTGEEGLVVQFGEPATVADGETATALMVFGADARIEGTVQNVLVVVGGRADVSGAVDGDVVVVDGELALSPGASVSGDVTLFGSPVTGAEAATIGGILESDPTIEVGRAAALFAWTSATLAFIALALGIVALFGARSGSVHMALTTPARAGLVGLAVVLALPILAVFAFTTGVGFGIGFVLLAVLPGLLVAGYVVAAIALGIALFGRFQPLWLSQSWGPYGAAVLGVLVLQILWVVPFLGLLSAYAALHGVGALAASAALVRSRSEKSAEASSIPTSVAYS